MSSRVFTLDNLTSTSFKRKDKKRVGRGRGSNTGKTSTRGHKGQSSRAGSGGCAGRVGREGGRKPLYLTLPTRGGIKGLKRDKIAIINLNEVFRKFSDLEEINLSVLKEKNCIAKKFAKYKILGSLPDFEFSSSIKKVVANKISRSAKEFLEKMNIVVNEVMY